MKVMKIISRVLVDSFSGRGHFSILDVNFTCYLSMISMYEHGFIFLPLYLEDFEMSMDLASILFYFLVIVI